MIPAFPRLLLLVLPLAACTPETAERPVTQAAAPATTREGPTTVVRATAPAAPPAATPARLTPTLSQPFGIWLDNITPARAAEPAPLPNRDIEAPRPRDTNELNPRLEPMMMPTDRRQGSTFGTEHLRETGPDRPLDTLVQGARLRIPFESEVRR